LRFRNQVKVPFSIVKTKVKAAFDYLIAAVEMSDQTWTVVRFIDQDTVEAVPSSWIVQNRCYWPPFKNDKIMAIIRKNEQPDTCWPSCEISVFRNGTFGKCMQYLFIYL
jgi:hypothetical protein